jgi:hypothetical protein
MQCPKSQLPRPAEASSLSGRLSSYSRECRTEFTSAGPTCSQASSSEKESKRQPGNIGGECKAKSCVEQTRARPRNTELLTSERMRIGEWKAGERRKASRARNLGRGYLHGLHLLGAAVLYYVAVACELCIQQKARFPSGGDSA